MPPRAPSLPRNLHLPTHKTVKQTWLAPKPHLAHLHLDTPPLTTSQPSFHPPQSPQLPSRRQPVYNPGGFGLGASDHSKGKQRAVEEVEAKEGEAEACYVVSPNSPKFGISHIARLEYPASSFQLPVPEPELGSESGPPHQDTRCVGISS